jgi:hypothetical protein
VDKTALELHFRFVETDCVGARRAAHSDQHLLRLLHLRLAV